MSKETKSKTFDNTKTFVNKHYDDDEYIVNGSQNTDSIVTHNRLTCTSVEEIEESKTINIHITKDKAKVNIDKYYDDDEYIVNGSETIDSLATVHSVNDICFSAPSRYRRGISNVRIVSKPGNDAITDNRCADDEHYNNDEYIVNGAPSSPIIFNDSSRYRRRTCVSNVPRLNTSSNNVDCLIVNEPYNNDEYIVNGALLTSQTPDIMTSESTTNQIRNVSLFVY
jgi:hypothetical protein